MFSKTTSPGSGPARPATPSSPPVPDRSAGTPARPAVRVASILGADLLFEGSISGEGELLIDGHVKGDVHVARLVIGEHAHVEGTVRGAAIEVRGQVTGNVEGKAIHLLASAHVEGDIVHEQLSIDVGAFFQGRCSQFRPQPVAQAAAAPPAPPAAAPAQPITVQPAAPTLGNAAPLSAPAIASGQTMTITAPPAQPSAEVIPLDVHQA